MTLYVDSSAWVKRYVLEPGSAECIDSMQRDPRWTTARHTVTEVHRAVSRALGSDAAVTASGDFDADLLQVEVIEIDAVTSAMAVEVARTTGARTLDALHLAAMLRVDDAEPRLLTYDVRMRAAALQLGLRLVEPT